MKIIVHNAELVELDVLTQTLRKLSSRADDYAGAELFPRLRNRDGFAEILVQATYHSGNTITIGAIQRKPGEPVEFHS